MNKVRIVCALHRLAVVWAERNGYEPGTYVTLTKSGTLRGLPANTEIIVVDTPFKFEDSSKLNEILKRFTNVRHELFAGS